MKILVLGATGMLGSMMMRLFQKDARYEAWGTMRDISGLKYFPVETHSRLIHTVDVLDENRLRSVFDSVQPDVVINCVGLIKQLANADDPLIVLPVNAMLPHRLARLCGEFGARLIHISTDCVFAGDKGFYDESSESDAKDLYGKSKYIGEVTQLPHVITLRTSIIGHELNSCYALIDWFLSQKKSVNGYVNAIYSGLPTVELIRVIMDYVLPRSELNGLYQVASNPINKYDLLMLVSEVYGKKITIIPDETFSIDRSLNGARFATATNYIVPEWPQLVEMMFRSQNLAGVN